MSLKLRANDVFWKYFTLFIVLMYLSLVAYFVGMAEMYNRRQLLKSQQLISDILGKNKMHMDISQNNGEMLRQILKANNASSEKTNKILEQLRKENTVLLRELLSAVNGSTKPTTSSKGD